MEELLGRKTPHSAPAEQAVIGSMLIDPRCVPEVLEKLKADEFYIKLNRDIYETMYAMFSYGQTIDPVTVLDQMKVRGVYQDGNENYLAEIMRVTPTAANVLEYAAIVRDRALLRRLGETADEINNMVYEGSGEADTMLEAAERKIYALRQGRTVGGLMPISMVVQTVFDRLSEAASSGNKIPGLPTGLPDLDRTILGLNKSELILIAARPGMGKTSIALNIALNVGIAVGATSILVPEIPYDFEKDVMDRIRVTAATGKKHFIIVVAEGVGHVTELAEKIEKTSGIETRATILGHVQRGGSPTLRDRVLASRMGYEAVQLLEAGKSNRVVAIQSDRIVDFDIEEALAMKKLLDVDLYRMAHEISI